MASTHLDEFVLNFDLNQLPQPNETNVKTVEQKYERLRKNLHIVKSTIITSHFLLQKYNTKKEEHEELLKVHAATREELTQLCIKFKDASDKCEKLENEKKILLASQEEFKEGKLDSENKYCALISHTNQLQMLVKQLQTEKDALMVEKELDKFNDKGRTQEVIQLQQEKAAMLMDLIALKDVIIDKKKTRKKHIKILKKYVREMIHKDADMSKSGESNDDMDSPDNFVVHTPQDLGKVLQLADKEIISSAELNFIDNCSDSSNGEVSVDTGRGSSRANSHDKCLSSPDYVFTSETVLKTSHKNVKQIEVANSPITVNPPKSVATSPIIFDPPSPLFDDHYDEYADCFDGSEIVFETADLSEELDEIQEQEKFIDVCTSPIPEVRKFIDAGTDPIKNDEYMLMDSSSKSSKLVLNNESSKNKEPKEYSITIDKQNHRCFCRRDKKKFVDRCTSPIPKLLEYCRFVEMGTCDVFDVNSQNLDDLQNQTSKIVAEPKKKFVDACTSPISTRDRNMCVDIGTNVYNIDMVNLEDGKRGYQSSINCDTSSCNGNVTQTEKKFVDVGTSTVSNSDEHCEVVGKETNDLDQNNMTISTSINGQEESQQSNVRNQITSRPTNETTTSIGRDNKMLPQTERLRRREKVCLESNSSKNLSFENCNDSEVQHILNVMKIHNDLVSPISKTPSDSHYLTLLPEMNSTLTKIWAAISHIYKTPISNIDSNLSDLNEIETVEIADVQVSSSNKRSQPERVTINREPQINLALVEEHNKTVDEDIIDTTNTLNEGTDSINESITSPETLNAPAIGNSNVMKSKENNLEITANTDLLQKNKVGEVITIVDEIRIFPNQKPIESYKIVNNIREDDIIKTQADNNDIFDANKGHTEMPKVKRSPKPKNKSKLQKLRNKLVPSCKIKKMEPSIKKLRSNTNLNILKPKQPNSITLNQKLAYEKAVKVMAELRSNKERQTETKLLSPKSENIKQFGSSNNTEPIRSESMEVKTRNRTRNERLSNKHGETTVTVTCQESQSLEQNLRDIEKSPGNRKLRKRPADTEMDRLQGNCKRILRSSNVSRVTDEMELPKICQNKNTEPLYLENSTNKEKNNHVKNLNSVITTHKSDNFNVKNNKKIESSLITTNNDHTEPIKSDIRMMKPVIDLSKCLNDNAVSIISGNVGYLDGSTNTDVATAGLQNHMLQDQNNYENCNRNEPIKAQINNDLLIVEKLATSSNIDSHYNIQVTNNSQHELNKALNETKHDDSNNSTEGHISINNNDSNKVMEPYNTETLNEDISDSFNDVQRDYRTKHDIMTQRTSNIRTEQSAVAISKEDMSKSKDIYKEVKLGGETKKVIRNPVVEIIPLKKDVISSCLNNIVHYSDLELYEENSNVQDKMDRKTSKDSGYSKENILCAALDRYGVISVKYTAKKVPDTITVNISQKFEESFSDIIASPKNEQKAKMDQLVIVIQHQKPKYILSGLMKYLKDPTRKIELFNTIINGAAPPMTRSEMILLYVIEKLNESLPSGFVERVWNNIEHALFQLNRAPEFGAIESMAHFYAVLCRYFRNKSRLRCFMLDAMYCLQFKAVPLIRQCLDVCPGVLPYAHEHMAKTSLVTCLVYLLHFYKCQDKFNRAQDVRNILYRKYSYRFAEWNETMILEIFRKAIMDLRGTHNDKKMLRVALIILCKRHGAKWCQMNIIQNMLLPIIEKKDVPERIKQFCVLMLGPLLKPFPADRKAQCEIVINQLLQMLKQDNSQGMTEAIYSSLIFMNKHDQERVVQALLHWNPENISQDFKEILNDYVMEKPLAVWKKLVTRKPSQCS